MTLECICFPPMGRALAERILPELTGWQTELTTGYGPEKPTLRAWTSQVFARADALLFIGAAGIAVRAIAAHIGEKTRDPAVLAMDEKGDFVIPLLGGHVGGANRLARQLAARTGGRAAITTGTDVAGLWAVDEWAARRGMHIHNPERIKVVSAKLLRGERVALYSALPLRGALPQGVFFTSDSGGSDVFLSPRREAGAGALHLVPRCIALGIGCRRGVLIAALERTFRAALEAAKLHEEAICGVFSIDRKADEAALLRWCEEKGWALQTYSASALRRVDGSVSPSAFVRSATGVDNVCERSALLEGGELLLPKLARDGVTVALVQRGVSYDWGERDE